MSWSAENIERNLLLFKIYSFFREIDFTRAVFIVYLLSLGVSNCEIGVLQTVLFLAIVLFEVPSGIMADKFKRKWVLAAGSLFMAASFSFFYFAEKSFPLLIVAFALIGVSFALNSGSDAALLYDGLVQTNKEKRHLEVMGKVRSLSTIALCFSVSFGGFLLNWSAASIFILTGIAALISFVLIALLPESGRAKSEKVAETYKKFFKTIEGKKLFRFILLLALIEAVYTPVFIFSQSLFKEQGLSVTVISMVIAMSFLLEAFCFRYVAFLGKWKTSTTVFATLGLMSTSLLLIYYFNNTIASVALFFVYNTAPAMLFAKTDDYIQTQAKPEIRASLTSTHSLINALGVSAGYLVFGFGFDQIGAVASLALVGVFIVALAAGFAVYFGKEEQSVAQIA